MIKIHLDHAHLHHLLRQMIRIRHFEAKCVELYQAQKILGFLHLYDGEEAVSVGVMEALAAEDAVVATYREHGQAIARGIGMDRLMAEMLGKREGCCRGRGGSMHIFDRATRFYGGNAIVGGGLPLAVGMRIAEDAFFDLDAPLRRVCGREVPMPYAPHLEDAALPQPADIAATARTLVRGA